MGEIEFLRVWFWLSLIPLGLFLMDYRHERIADRIVRRCKEAGITVVDGDKIFVVKK